MSKDLVIRIYNTSKTVDIMDRFEGINKGGVRYDRLIIENGGMIYGSKRYYFYQLVIERSISGADYGGSCTFTEYKKNSYCIQRYVKSQFKNTDVDNAAASGGMIRFSRPWLLKAQNSRNKTGYGWVWNWKHGIGYVEKEGTQYGETTSYAIVGVLLKTV